MMRASSVAEATARAVVAAVGKLRREPLSKAPGIAEAVDWAEAATLLHKGGARWPDAFKRAIGVALKDEEDLAFIVAAARRPDRRGRGMSEFEPCRARRAPSSASSALLRANGFAIAPEQTHRVPAAIELLGPRDLEDIRRAGLATLAPPPERRAAYDALFRIHFLGGEASAEPDAETTTRSCACRRTQRGEDEPLLADETNESGAGRDRGGGAGRAPLRAGRSRRGAAPTGARGAAAAAAAARLSPHARAARRRWSTCGAPCATPRATTARC